MHTIFLGYQFDSNYYPKSALLSVFEDAVETAEQDLRNAGAAVTLRVVHRAIALGKPLSQEIIDAVRASSAAIFELSDSNRNVLFELGVAVGSGLAGPILLYEKNSKVPIASDVSGLLHLPYSRGRLESLEGRIAKHLKNTIEGQTRSRPSEEDAAQLRRLWSGGGGRITVVCPELPKAMRPLFAEPGSPEFINVARYGDTDTLLEVLRLLQRLVPTREVSWRTWKDVRSADRRANLIIIGGPDYNRLSRDMMREGAVPIQYEQVEDDTRFRDRVSGRSFALESRRSRIRLDYGLFARFPNPLNRRAMVLLLGGLQTLGVLAAARAFPIRGPGSANLRFVAEEAGGALHFCALVPAPVVNGELGSLRLDRSTFHPYPWARPEIR